MTSSGEPDDDLSLKKYGFDTVELDEEEEDSGPPEEPPPPDPGDDHIPFAKRANSVANAEEWAAAFNARRLDGIRRAQRIAQRFMVAPTAEAIRAGDREIERLLGVFEDCYRTDRISHTDLIVQATWALRTKWKRATGPTAYYENTPQPSHHRIVSFQLERATADEQRLGVNEELNPSDVYFLQYYRAAGTQQNPLPRLDLLIQQQAYSKPTQPIYDYLRLINPEQDGNVEPAEYFLGSAAYYAFLGSPNGSPVAYLTHDWGWRLGINGISSIRIDGSLNLYFTFSHPGTGTGTTSSASSSSSTSTSTSST